MDDLNECYYKAELKELRFIGNYFTWNNCSEVNNRIMCKFDRPLVNEK